MLFYVPTPMGVGGIADLAAVEQIRDGLPAGAVVVNKSTVPVGAAVRTAELLESPSTHSPCTKIRSRPGPRRSGNCGQTCSSSSS